MRVMFGHLLEHSGNHTTVHKVSCGCEGFLMMTPVILDSSGLLCGCGDSDQFPLPGSLKSGLKVGLGKKVNYSILLYLSPSS